MGREYRVPVDKDEPLWLMCCAEWMMRQPRAIEVMDVAFWAEKNALSTVYNSDNPMCVALKNGYKHFDAGYNEGMDEKLKSEEAIRKAQAGKK